MKSLLLLFLGGLLTNSATAGPRLRFFAADNPAIQYTGRIDFTTPRLPRFWAPGAYVTIRFAGTHCELIINDEVPGGTSHNYLEVVVDGQPTRLRLTDKTNTLTVADGLAGKSHTLTICKDTESGIGYVEVVGFRCAALLPPVSRPARKIEFIGNSITCGTGSDLSAVACGQGQWQDQHNAYCAYGPATARALNAQYHLTAVSGIGLIHSCCDLAITMPDVFDKVNLRANALPWDFGRYQPDVVTICLGQNDGVQDSAQFCAAYVRFVQTIRGHYPAATIVCLTSPMADARLTAVLRRYLTSVVAQATAAGDKKVRSYFFARSYHGGCDAHPNVAEQQLIAQELTQYLRETLRW